MAISKDKNRPHHRHGNYKVPQALILEAITRRIQTTSEHGTSGLAQQMTGSAASTTRPRVDEASYDISGA